MTHTVKANYIFPVKKYNFNRYGIVNFIAWGMDYLSAN